MFGIAVANISSISQLEKKRYKEVYCGLCFELKQTYGQVSRVALNYDLTFLNLLYDSLYEPVETSKKIHCIAHPKKLVECTTSKFTSYCAALSVALAYHKCLDDITDDYSSLAKIAEVALSRSYDKARNLIPEQCCIIEDALNSITAIEKNPDSQIKAAQAADAASKSFGELLGFLFETCPVCFPDIWSKTLYSLGYDLGRFIYLMDNAIDFKVDEQKGAYNPFVNIAKNEGTNLPNPKMMRNILSVIADKAAISFEKLPLLKDVNILRSVLYSGLWQKFNYTYKSSDEDKSHTDMITNQ